jgi:PEP-CTERM putative exosortase interaction domain
MPFAFMAIFPLLGCLPATAQTLVASEDTFITTHPELSGENSNHGPDTFLYMVGDNLAPFATSPLVKFDLSLFSGQTVLGDATFSIHVSYASEIGGDRFIDVHEVLAPWTEGSVTWNNFGVTPGFQFGVDAATGPVDSQLLAPGESPITLEFTIPHSLVQSWIDSPENNHGILLHMVSGSDVNFDSSEFGGIAPSLTFEVVPEPSGVLLLLGSAGLLAIRRRR